VLGETDLAISARDTLQGYTLNAATLVHREHDLGSLETGKCADIVILGDDPLLVPSDEIGAIPVHETWVAGGGVYPS